MICDVCTYKPRSKDAQNIVLETGKDSKEETILYVRCYRCGHEWVE
jgi:hypothetical protein